MVGRATCSAWSHLKCLKCYLCAFALFCHLHKFLILQEPGWNSVALPLFSMLYYYRIITPRVRSLTPYERNRTRSKSIIGICLVKIIESDAPLGGSVSWMAREMCVSIRWAVGLGGANRREGDTQLRWITRFSSL